MSSLACSVDVLTYDIGRVPWFDRLINDVRTIIFRMLGLRMFIRDASGVRNCDSEYFVWIQRTYKSNFTVNIIPYKGAWAEAKEENTGPMKTNKKPVWHLTHLHYGAHIDHRFAHDNVRLNRDNKGKVNSINHPGCRIMNICWAGSRFHFENNLRRYLDRSGVRDIRKRDFIYAHNYMPEGEHISKWLAPSNRDWNGMDKKYLDDKKESYIFVSRYHYDEDGDYADGEETAKIMTEIIPMSGQVDFTDNDNVENHSLYAIDHADNWEVARTPPNHPQEEDRYSEGPVMPPAPKKARKE